MCLKFWLLRQIIFVLPLGLILPLFQLLVLLLGGGSIYLRGESHLEARIFPQVFRPPVVLYFLLPLLTLPNQALLSSLVLLGVPPRPFVILPQRVLLTTLPLPPPPPPPLSLWLLPIQSVEILLLSSQSVLIVPLAPPPTE